MNNSPDVRDLINVHGIFEENLEEIQYFAYNPDRYSNKLLENYALVTRPV